MGLGLALGLDPNQVPHLVLHQRDEGPYDEMGVSTKERRQGVRERLASAGGQRHVHVGVAAAHRLEHRLQVVRV